MILAGDIGGTKTNVALFDEVGGRLAIVEGSQRKFVSKQEPSLEAVIEKYLKEFPGRRIDHAGFGIAGPVKNGVCKATNLAWEVHADRVAKLLGIGHVGLVNDLVANAAGIEVLPEGSIKEIIARPAVAEGNRCIISAGTGLGQGSMIWDEHGKKYVPVPSEGGHAEFAPRSEVDVELWRWLTARYGRAEWEHVLSGPGFFNIYSFLKEAKGREEPGFLRDKLATMDHSAAVSEAALAGTAAIAVETMEMFVRYYGTQAGNVALNVVAVGGVYIGGGIAPKILPKLVSDTFRAAFVEKGKLKGLMEGMPVRVILNADTALYGAAVVGKV